MDLKKIRENKLVLTEVTEWAEAVDAAVAKLDADKLAQMEKHASETVALADREKELKQRESYVEAKAIEVSNRSEKTQENIADLSKREKLLADEKEIFTAAVDDFDQERQDNVAAVEKAQADTQNAEQAQIRATKAEEAATKAEHEWEEKQLIADGYIDEYESKSTEAADDRLVAATLRQEADAYLESAKEKEAAADKKLEDAAVAERNAQAMRDKNERDKALLDARAAVLGITKKTEALSKESGK